MSRLHGMAIVFLLASILESIAHGQTLAKYLLCVFTTITFCFAEIVSELKKIREKL